MEYIVNIEDLTVSYDDSPVLWDIDLNLPKGKIIAIVGPNGAGKSTLIKTMLNLIKPVTGDISFNGKPYKDIRRSVAYVPQKETVDWNFPTTVLDVVLMGRYGHIGWFKRVTKKDERIALDALDKIGILNLKDRQISELSGGQQQRTFLARALAQEADIYLMDEPFAGVDIQTEGAIVKLFKALQTMGKTIVVVHHNLDTVKAYFDWVILLNKRVVVSGDPSEVFTKENIELTYKGHRLIKSHIED